MVYYFYDAWLRYPVDARNNASVCLGVKETGILYTAGSSTDKYNTKASPETFSDPFYTQPIQ